LVVAGLDLSNGRSFLVVMTVCGNLLCPALVTDPDLVEVRLAVHPQRREHLHGLHARRLAPPPQRTRALWLVQADFPGADIRWADLYKSILARTI
jgi:hypothetical protein